MPARLVFTTVRWATWIAGQLEDEGYRVKIQAWDMLPGQNFVLEMDKAARNAECTLSEEDAERVLLDAALGERGDDFRNRRV